MNIPRKSVFAVAFLLMAGAAQAADAPDSVPADTYAKMGLYLRADAGWSFLDWAHKSDSAPALGVGVGYRFNDNLRTDLRVDYSGGYSVAPGGDMQVGSVLGNLYVDIPTGTMITPYLGAGVGYGWTQADKATDKSGAAFALMGGVNVGLTDNLSLDAGYRFRDIMSKGSNPTEHQFLAGLRYEF